jgi:hypothetical protein
MVRKTYGIHFFILLQRPKTLAGGSADRNARVD